MDNNTLEKLFKNRERSYKRATNNIFKAITHATDGVMAFLQDTTEINKGELTWQEVMLHDKIVVIVGFVQYPVGASFTSSAGEEIVVDENNVDYFKRVMRITLPQELVERGTTEQITEFMHALQQEASLEAENDMVVLPVGEGDVPPEIAEALEEVAEFDLGELTEEQQRNLHFITKEKQ